MATTDEILDYEDLVGTSSSSSSSSSGLPDWASEYIQNLIGATGGAATSKYLDSLMNLSDDTDIETYRTESNKQYQRDILQPTTDAINSAIRSAAGGGIVNSSITGDWIQSAIDSALASAEEQNTESNIWAAEQKIESKEETADAWGDYSSMLKDYLGLTSTSSSSSSSSALESILEYLDLASADDEEDDESSSDFSYDPETGEITYNGSTFMKS